MTDYVKVDPLSKLASVSEFLVATTIQSWISSPSIAGPYVTAFTTWPLGATTSIVSPVFVRAMLSPDRRTCFSSPDAKVPTLDKLHVLPEMSRSFHPVRSTAALLTFFSHTVSLTDSSPTAFGNSFVMTTVAELTGGVPPPFASNRVRSNCTEIGK